MSDTTTPETSDAAAGRTMSDLLAGRCKTCRYWQKDESRYNRAIDPEWNPVTGDEWENEEEKRKFFPDTVRYCKHPKVVFYERPAPDGVAVFDGSEYMAYLGTGEEFGCVNHEAS